MIIDILKQYSEDIVNFGFYKNEYQQKVIVE